MKTIEQLKLGYSDAQNYSKRKDKVFFNEIFVRNSFLDKLLNENVYFLIGEKGTGKTAYATFLSNNNYKDTRGVLSYINATDYEKFYTLKKNNHLELSDFNSIWKVIILLLFSQFITKNESTVAAFNKSKLKQLNQAIESDRLSSQVQQNQRKNFLSTSKGVRKLRRFLGRLLIISTKCCRSSSVTSAKEVPFGKNCRSRPLVFSFVPRCQGE